MTKHYFKTGLVIVLPAILTLWIINFIINFLTDPFIHFTTELFSQFSIFQFPHYPAIQSTMILVISKFAIMLLICFFILLIGMFAEYFFMKSIIGFGSKLFSKTPFINKIHQPIQDLVSTFFSSTSTSFSEVTLAPFPEKHSSVVGLISNKKISFLNEDLTAVYIPATPNPTYGFLIMTSPKELKSTELSVDDAMKYVISCGVAVPTYKDQQGR